MRRQEKKDRPAIRCKRGGSSGGGGGGGGGGGITGRKNVKDAPDTMKEATTLKPKMDLMDVFDDIETIAPTMKANDANALIRQALNLGPTKAIPDEVSSSQASQIMRMIALKSRFNLRNSDLKHYLD